MTACQRPLFLYHKALSTARSGTVSTPQAFLLSIPTRTMGLRSIVSLLLFLLSSWVARNEAFVPVANRPSRVAPLSMSSDTQERIQKLVDEHPVLLFMKGSKLFPQCGFSNTAVQILNSFGIAFETVDVLADDSIRQGVKDFSQWPTIPQLYVAGEFIGGSDIMIEMYQSGELGEMIEKAKADMM